MDEAAKIAIQVVRQIVGNHVQEPFLYHRGQMSHLTVDDIRCEQAEIMGRLDAELSQRQITDEGARSVLDAMRKYDWGDPASYKTFRGIFDAYVAPVEQAAIMERDAIFGARRFKP